MPLFLTLTSDPTDTSSATTTTTTITGTTNSSLDYLAYIRHLKIERWDHDWECNWKFFSADLEPHQLEYLQSDEFDQLYKSNPFAPEYLDWATEGRIQQYYRITTRLDAFWCLAEPILEQLQSITIPTSRIKQYHKVVGRFKSLESVHFSTARTFEDPFINKKQRRVLVVQEIMRFVQEHIRLFKGQLRTVQCLEDGMWDGVDHEYIQRVQLGFYRILPPLSRPTHLGRYNWLQFLVCPESVDLAHVQEFDSVYLPEQVEDTVFVSRHSVLQRCRSLRKLFISTNSPDTFKWAVQEKRDLDVLGRNAMAGNNQGGRRPMAQVETSQQTHWTHGLVPLEYIDIELTSPNTDDIDDVVFAFSQTLKHLRILSFHFSPLGLPYLIQFGQGWVDLPALTELCLNQRFCRIVLDPQLLAHCPNLTSLRLQDDTLEYSSRDIVPCPPARLERLVQLHLTGWPALTFDPATLSSTTRLTHLTLETLSWGVDEFGKQVRREFIPPVEELNRSYGIQDGSPAWLTIAATELELDNIRPRWTWDWQLPLLAHLHLTSEFAYMFDFKFLQGCPALETLRLNIPSTTPGEHTRVISESNLSVPSSNAISRSSSQPMTDQLTLPCLSTLDLLGEWTIDDHVTQQLLTKTFPRVKQFCLQQWTMTTLESLLRVLKALPQIRTTTATSLSRSLSPGPP
ncbi:MAG: hypothetical protein JOS17DRAFT_833827 [Linnemannia elongata]|nr:MAG: hypothetical protein JOS17DRAFT_833827 [Linnemannia elongata]